MKSKDGFNVRLLSVNGIRPTKNIVHQFYFEKISFHFSKILTLCEKENTVRSYDFIFSQKRPFRISRHLIFWMVFLVYFYYVNLIPSKPEDLSNPKTYFEAFKLMIYFPVSVIAVYVAIYFLLPRYILTEKYLKLILIVSGFTIVYFFMALLLTMLLARLTTHIPFQKLPVAFKWFQPVRYGIGLPLTSSVLATIIKLFKTWDIEQKENEALQRQKINTEMQLLKTQFQPQFLYESLMHLYHLVVKHSPQSPETILKLSDLLSYLLYENEKARVPLEKELEIVQSYLSLKKTIYPNRLFIQVNQKNEIKDLLIAPLLLLSLVENCLEKFLNTPEQTLSLKLEIDTEQDEIHFLLQCKSNFKNGFNEEGDQWIKSLKRLEILYPGKYNFNVHSENAITRLLLILKANMRPFIAEQKKEFILS
ncbi:MAG: histidine kinase [Ginsengibacter sp.]